MLNTNILQLNAFPERFKVFTTRHSAEKNGQGFEAMGFELCAEFPSSSHRYASSESKIIRRKHTLSNGPVFRGHYTPSIKQYLFDLGIEGHAANGIALTWSSNDWRQMLFPSGDNPDGYAEGQRELGMVSPEPRLTDERKSRSEE